MSSLLPPDRCNINYPKRSKRPVARSQQPGTFPDRVQRQLQLQLFAIIYHCISTRRPSQSSILKVISNCRLHASSPTPPTLLFSPNQPSTYSVNLLEYRYRLRQLTHPPHLHSTVKAIRYVRHVVENHQEYIVLIHTNLVSVPRLTMPAPELKETHLGPLTSTFSRSTSTSTIIDKDEKNQPAATSGTSTPTPTNENTIGKSHLLGVEKRTSRL